MHYEPYILREKVQKAIKNTSLKINLQNIKWKNQFKFKEKRNSN
jgi:hypothetical protein